MLAIVYNPRLIKQMGDWVFYYPSGRTVGRVKAAPNEQIELNAQLISSKSVNFIEATVWEAIESTPANKPTLDWMKNAGALRVFKPDAEVPVGSTCDFNDLSVVREIVEASTDVNWLNVALARDQRREVFPIIRDRISEIQDARAQKVQAATFG